MRKMGKLFGTDGVRGVANTELTPELAFLLGRAGAYVLTKEKPGDTAIQANKGLKIAPKVLLGKDSRVSGDMLEAALTAGLCSIGAQVYCAGVVPSPAVAFLVRHYKLDAGVMISASHNPMADNGIKFFSGEGYKLPDALEDEIETLVSQAQQGNDTLPRPTGAEVGTVEICKTASQDYAAFLLETVPGLTLEGLKIVLDCANGATSEVAPIVFKNLGADVHVINNEPDGVNINKNCGSTHMDGMIAQVKQINADAGFAFDGDGDRMLAADETGEEMDGDAILAVCGLKMHERGELDEIVVTVMSNQGLEIFCEKNNIKLFRTAVGDRYVLEKMLADNLPLGGEQSGHVIFKNHNTTGDGILSALKLAEIMSEKKASLSQLKNAMEALPQVLVNATVPNNRKPELDTNEAIQKTQAKIIEQMAGEGRILVRPSGTEPLVRVMLEGRSKEKIQEWANELASVIQLQLN